jgi:ligand-binding sensor domain-containing protein/two-component sensor histidine kinase
MVAAIRVIIIRIAQAVALVLALSSPTNSERLSIKSYSTADGLAHNNVNRIVRDSRGFLWFCTREGLSRFDGYSFTNYGIDQGLSSASVNGLLETRDGQYWVATASGLCRFNPKQRPLSVVQHRSPTASNSPRADDPVFRAYFPDENATSRYVLSLLEDRTGAIWCGTRNGLYRVDAAGDEVRFLWVDLGIPDYLESRWIECLLEDRAGSLWVGSRNGLYRRWPDGRFETYTTRDGLPDNGIHSLLEDREGCIWAGTLAGGACRLVPDPAPGRNVVARVYSDKDGLPKWIYQLFQASDGSLWAGSNAGLIQFIATGDRNDFRFRKYAQPHGFSYHEVMSLAEDSNSNLWVGMNQGGAAKIARSGFTTFGVTDGFFYGTTSIFESRAGGLFVIGAPDEGERSINRFDGERFIRITPQFPKPIHGFSWGWNQIFLEDHLGDWWMATHRGVCRFPKLTNPEELAHTPAKAVYTTREGLAADVILRLFEDSHGDVWISSVGEGKRPNGLSRWERSTGIFYHYTEKDIQPRLDIYYASSFAEDRAGGVWIGFSGEGGLVRYRDGRFTLFTTSDGVPSGQIRNLFVDSAGHLWAPTYRGGLCRIDDPTAASPQFVTYTTADGLSSNEVSTTTEDRWGRIYIGTGRGIDRLDLTTGRVKHYTTADGLPIGEIQAAVSDRSGALWFSFGSSLVRLIPELDPPAVSPPILITGIGIAGEAQTISALGQTEVASLELEADRNQLQIEFVGLGFGAGEGLLYQYRLEGANDVWSQPNEHRTVNFANLAPGRYRFLVRAINADGVMSDPPAGFSFTILPPFWQRWWFVAIVAALVGLIAYGPYRYRVRRLLEIERVRTRIASDLHDDIGAGLSRIAVLSEVARHEVGGGTSPVVERLSAIARASRELVDSMSDIVWVINPERDHLRDLTHRMRRFASDVFTSRGIEFTFRAPVDEQHLKLGADMRRQVFLIFKEAINNVVRHADCAQASVQLAAEGGWFTFTVKDDGQGFDAEHARDGNGLVNMRERARVLGAQLQVDSGEGCGTTVTLRVPFNATVKEHNGRLRGSRL